MQNYDHKQYGRLHYLLGLTGAGCAAAALLSGPAGAEYIVLLGTAALFFILAGGFVHLHVRGNNHGVEIAFGPLRFFRTRVLYKEMESVEINDPGILSKWGIHGMPGKSVTWHIAGKQCVQVHLRDPHGFFRFRVINIGSDKPEVLAAFLRNRIDAATPEASNS